MIGPIVGGSEAAGAQEDSAQLASQTQLQMYNQEQANLQPYMNTGVAANNALMNGTGLNGGNPLASQLLSPVTMNQQTLEQTPGYQFNLQQGLKSVQNSASARGLGVSGAAQKGAASYATGLADSTYQNQFNNAVTNQTNQFNRLMGLTQLGQNSAAGVGAAGIQTGQSIGNNLIGAGNAQAAMYNQAGNALSNTGSTAAMMGFLNSGGGAAAASSTAAGDAATTDMFMG